MRGLKHFIASEAGAITVDWVLLVAGCVALGLGATALVVPGVREQSYAIEGRLQSDIIQTSFGAPNASADSALPNLYFDEQWNSHANGIASASTDAELQSDYNLYYSAARGGSAEATDILAHIEREMGSRGMAPPPGNLSHRQIYVQNGGAF